MDSKGVELEQLLKGDKELLWLLRKRAEALIAYERAELALLDYLAHRSQGLVEVAGTSSAENALVGRQPIVSIEHRIQEGSPSKILEIPLEELQQLGRGELLARVTKHYHRQISRMIGDVEIHYDDIHKVYRAARFLEKNPRVLAMMAKRELVYIKGNAYNREISGWEILRLHYRPDGREGMKVKDFTERFYISPAVFERLAKFFFEVRTKKGEKVLLPRSAAGFYDLIFPVERNDKYDHVRSLLTESEAESSVQNYREDVAPPQPELIVRLPKAIDEKVEDHYIPIPKMPLRMNMHYTLIPIRDEPDKDAFNIRHRILHRDGSQIVLVNSSDIERLILATRYIPQSVLENILRKSGNCDIERTGRVLELLGIPPILYNGDLVYPPGAAEIAKLRDEEIVDIVKLVQPIVKKYGPFIPFDVIKNLIGRGYITQNEFLRDRVSAPIGFMRIGEKAVYNTAQVVIAYRDAFGSPT